MSTQVHHYDNLKGQAMQLRLVATAAGGGRVRWWARRAVTAADCSCVEMQAHGPGLEDG